MKPTGIINIALLNLAHVNNSQRFEDFIEKKN
jgi:hypothetical protein